jgi:hypothetical protein
MDIKGGFRGIANTRYLRKFKRIRNKKTERRIK